MTVHRTTQLPISVGSARKRDVRTQFAALCYRIVKDRPQVLLITSRDTGRWIIPKGWPMDGKTPAQAAHCEAFEEAGVEGRAFDHVLGIYSYEKVLDDDSSPLSCVVAVFPVKVRRLVDDFPEVGQRKRKWMTLSKAADRVHEPDLAHIISRFDPHRLPR